MPQPICIGYVLLSPPATSVVGMLAVKEQCPRLRNGRPWRQKDIDDYREQVPTTVVRLSRPN